MRGCEDAFCSCGGFFRGGTFKEANSIIQSVYDWKTPGDGRNVLWWFQSKYEGQWMESWILHCLKLVVCLCLTVSSLYATFNMYVVKSTWTILMTWFFSHVVQLLIEKSVKPLYLFFFLSNTYVGTVYNSRTAHRYQSHTRADTSMDVIRFFFFNKCKQTNCEPTTLFF